MSTLNHRFEQPYRPVKQKVSAATGTDGNRVFARFVVALVTLVFSLLVTSAISPPASQAAFPGVNGKIAFISDRDGNVEVYIMNADGANQTNLTNNPANDFSPSWSPDGTELVFISTRDDSNGEIYKMKADGSDVTRLTSNSAIDGNPAWSPDGANIVFQTNLIDGGNAWNIWSMNADGSNQTPLTTGSPQKQEPAWSPSGAKIAYRAGPDPGGNQLYTMNPDGTDQTLLPSNSLPFNTYSPDWSPDGQKLTFSGSIPGQPIQIYVVNADGSGGLTQLTTTGDNSEPGFSPDGTKIAFTTSLGDPTGEIYVMNTDGSGLTRLTDNLNYDAQASWQPAPSDTTPPMVNVSFPSPDGQNGWFVTSPVVGGVTADDTTTGGSNVTAITCTGATIGPITGLGTASASASLTVSTEGVNNVNCTATDSTGNSGAAGNSNNTATVQIDTAAPAIQITSPANGGVYILNTATASSYSCSDATSGVATCIGPVASGANFSASPVGAHTFIVSATDGAGNQAQLTNNYTIIYNFNGFFPPVDNLPVLNVVKAGRAIPVKFSLSGNQGLSIFEAGYPKSQPIPCDSTALVDGIEETATAGSSDLSYDASIDQYVYVWKTDKTWGGTCRQLVVKLNDGTSHQANFNFTK
jgi:Tol biopolymer transport system component